MIEFLVGLVIVGFLVWFATTYIPMAPPFKSAIYGIAAILLLLWLLRILGIWHGGPRL